MLDTLHFTARIRFYRAKRNALYAEGGGAGGKRGWVLDEDEYCYM